MEKVNHASFWIEYFALVLIVVFDQLSWTFFTMWAGFVGANLECCNRRKPPPFVVRC